MKREIVKIGVLLLTVYGLVACDEASSDTNPMWQAGGTLATTGGAGAAAPSFTGGAGAAAPVSTGGVGGPAPINTGGSSGTAGITAIGGTPSNGGASGSEIGNDAAVIDPFDASLDGSGTATAGAPGTGGTPGTGGSPGTGGTSGNVTTSQDPVIPPVTGDCPVFTDSTIDFNGLRGILMQVGPKANGGGSLIFYWHGTGSSNSEVNRLIPAAARQTILDAGGIIISPQTTCGVGNDCSGTGTFHMGDLDIADQIAACAVRDHNIDPHRIYTTGCSAGGLFAGCMALNRPQYIAAAAPNSGGGMGRFASSDHIPAVMTMHGAPGVDVVIIDFSQSSASFDSAVKNAGGFVINCNHGGSHCRVPGDLYTAAIQFMLDHPYGVDPKPYTSGLPASFPSYCTIF